VVRHAGKEERFDVAASSKRTSFAAFFAGEWVCGWVGVSGRCLLLLVVPAQLAHTLLQVGGIEQFATPPIDGGDAMCSS